MLFPWLQLQVPENDVPLTDHILTLITFVPTAGAIVVAFLPRKGRAIPAFTLLVTLATFVLSLHLPAHFNYALHGFQFEENQPWIASPAIRYHLGVDGLSLWLIVLATFLGPIGVLVSWRAINTHTKEFYFLFLLQQTAMIGVFAALDLFLYYGFWELSLVPMAILIAMFGPNRGRRPPSSFSSTPSSHRRSSSSPSSTSTPKPVPSTSPASNTSSPAAISASRRTCSPGSRSLSSSPSPSKFPSFPSTAGFPTSFRKRPLLWPWSSPANSASIPSSVSTSASSLPRLAPSRRS